MDISIAYWLKLKAIVIFIINLYLCTNELSFYNSLYLILQTPNELS